MRRDIPNLTKYQIILARDQFRKNPSPNIVGRHQGIIDGEYAICISLYHGYELLQHMGMRYFFLSGITHGTKATNTSEKKYDDTRVMIVFLILRQSLNLQYFFLHLQSLETFASSLILSNVLMRRDIPNLTKYQIILARDQFRKNPSPNIVGRHQGIIDGEYAICISLYHGYELLQHMGMRYFFLSGITHGTKVEANDMR
ncbi:Fanconi anemia group M protein homolog [Perognathus longimembris pacificus]|uniref:Fanconi anemia group M protein homolog n=1 Tax=Perognathus longimembris pacificus TaxID=214514 RepID=UPI0020198BD7|nr:Fanconi anemia group M protein homolog [Perognathus longimembris pacificus]